MAEQLYSDDKTKSEAFSAEKRLFNANVRCIYNFCDSSLSFPVLYTSVVLLSVLFRVVLFHFHSLSYLSWQQT